MSEMDKNQRVNDNVTGDKNGPKKGLWTSNKCIAFKDYNKNFYILYYYNIIEIRDAPNHAEVSIVKEFFEYKNIKYTVFYFINN